MVQEIKKLKKEKNAIILAHNYQVPEVQEIADFIGDSLELARISADLKEDIIVFCGVLFMAETAHILAPGKKVRLPVRDADCPMARMITVKEVLDLKKAHPKAAVVTYVNSTAAVKAVSDISCTSSNVLKIINSLEEDQIIFIPDKNLGKNVSRFIPKEFIFYDGFCPPHEGIREEEILKVRESMPEAEIIMHPEVNPKVAKHADKLLSTGGMLKYAKSVKGKKMVIGTEMGLIYRLQKEAKENTYFNVGRDMVCPNMKKIRLENIYKSLKEEVYQITVASEIREKAKKSIIRMLLVK